MRKEQLQLKKLSFMFESYFKNIVRNISNLKLTL